MCILNTKAGTPNVQFRQVSMYLYMTVECFFQLCIKYGQSEHHSVIPFCKVNIRT